MSQGSDSFLRTRLCSSKGAHVEKGMRKLEKNLGCLHPTRTMGIHHTHRQTQDSLRDTQALINIHRDRHVQRHMQTDIHTNT